MARSRIVNLLVAGAAGIVFLAGLFISGVVGAVLLLAVAGFLVLLTSAAWESVPSRGRRVRVLIVAVVVAIALVKLATS